MGIHAIWSYNERWDFSRAGSSLFLPRFSGPTFFRFLGPFFKFSEIFASGVLYFLRWFFIFFQLLNEMKGTYMNNKKNSGCSLTFRPFYCPVCSFSKENVECIVMLFTQNHHHYVMLCNPLFFPFFVFNNKTNFNSIDFFLLDQVCWFVIKLYKILVKGNVPC